MTTAWLNKRDGQEYGKSQENEGTKEIKRQRADER